MNGVQVVDMIGVEVVEDDYWYLGNVEVIQIMIQFVWIWFSIDDDSFMWVSMYQSCVVLIDVIDCYLLLFWLVWEGRMYDYCCYDCQFCKCS